MVGAAVSARPEFQGECEFCGYETSLTKYPTRRGFPKQPEGEKSLCLVCASTHGGQAHEYPEQYPDYKTMSMIAWGVNYIADLVTGKVKR